MRAYERLLKYVRVYTTSDPNSGTHPSAEREFDLARILVEDMKAIGIEDAFVDEHCYVYGTIPATPGCESKPALGLIAHMDTAPDASGENVNPILHENYDGHDVTLPAAMTAIPFGAGEAQVVSERDGMKTWRFVQESAGGILYAGDYVMETIHAGGMTIEFCYGRKHQAVMEEAGAVEAVRRVVEYCATRYGPLSFGAGETLKLIQSRVAGGGYAAGGASLLDEADFTAANLSNAEKGGGAGEVMIHELVHQWWGLGNMFDTADPNSPWSAEGLTCYTTYRIARQLYGEDYAQTHYVEPWQQAVDDYYLNFYVRHPEYLERLPEAQRLQISNSLSQMRQYCEMPLMILKAEELVGGEAAMDRILHALFNREMDPMYPYLTYEEFLDACGLTEEALDLA